MISHSIAKLWQQAYRVQYGIKNWKYRFGGQIFFVILILLLSLSFYEASSLQSILESQYKTDQAIEGLRGLILNIGSALIGATAIVTSLVLFAMQVNIERMPHGLFHRLSSDRNLLGAFTLAFLLAIAVATASTFVERSDLSIVVLTVFWAILVILLLFLYAYRRALVLINPTKQLEMIFEGTKKEFQVWGRRATRAIPLLTPKEAEVENQFPLSSSHDLARTTFFQIYSNWIAGAERSIRHSISFARRYAEQGDHEVSHAALSTVIGINAAYVETKGKTFFADIPIPLIDSRFSSDEFINDTLEHLRQNAQSAIVRRDELQIEQIFRTMAALVRVYLNIDYSNQGASKTHAHLAAVYLSESVKSVVSHNMADVLMEGLRLMGGSAKEILKLDSPENISTLSENIAKISSTGAVKEDYRPVTQVGMTQLADLSFDLLITKNHDIRFISEDIRKAVSLVVKNFLTVTDLFPSTIHSSYLAPYYSSTSTECLFAKLTELVNAISDLEEDSQNAKLLIRNLGQWANGINRTEKELLLATIKIKSSFTFDMIHWITGVTEILCAVSNAPACDTHSQNELRKHALRLILTLTWIPDDVETIKFVENYRITEIFFEAAMNARHRGCHQIAKEAREALFSWTFKGGKYETGQNILERGLYGLSILAILDGDAQVTEFKSEISTRLSSDTAPAKEIRNRTARNISESAVAPYRQSHLSSHIDKAIERADHEKLQPLLEEISRQLQLNNTKSG